MTITCEDRQRQINARLQGSKKRLNDTLKMKVDQVDYTHKIEEIMQRTRAEIEGKYDKTDKAKQLLSHFHQIETKAKEAQ